jgi:hypothetical protein
MLKAPVPSITVVKQHWAQSVLVWVTAYKRVNHTKDWLVLLLARCCIASWGIDPDAPWRRDAWLYGTPRWVLAKTRQEACDRLETTVMRPSAPGRVKTNKQTLLAVLDKKKVGWKSTVEKVLPNQTFLREGIPTQWPNQFVSYSISRFYVLVRTPWGQSWKDRAVLKRQGSLEKTGQSC